jgi:hypothetical protein
MTSHFIIDFITNYIFSYYKDSVWVTEGFPILFLFVPAVIFGACLALKFSWEKRDALQAQLQGKKTKPSKEQTGALASLNQTISDHQKYYWCAVAAIMIVTFIYHDYGMNSNGFHGVFPYSSVLF